MIYILCPTRGRKEQFLRMCDSVSKTGDASVMVTIFAQSNGNDDYVSRTSPDMPTVMMWNKLSELAYKDEGKLFMLGSDDILFTTPNWNKALIDHYNSLENKIHVYHLQDSRDPDGTPHPIVTREYLDAMGYFIPPVFLHWFADTWTVEIAKYNGVFTHLRDYELVHNKPSDFGNADETHNHIRRMGWHERDKYVHDTCQHFLQHEKLRLAKIIGDQHHKNYRLKHGMEEC